MTEDELIGLQASLQHLQQRYPAIDQTLNLMLSDIALELKRIRIVLEKIAESSSASADARAKRNETD